MTPRIGSIDIPALTFGKGGNVLKKIFKNKLASFFLLLHSIYFWVDKKFENRKISEVFQSNSLFASDMAVK